MALKQLILAWSLLCVMQHFIVETKSRSSRFDDEARLDNFEEYFGKIDASESVKMDSLLSRDEGVMAKRQEKKTTRYRRQLGHAAVDNNSSAVPSAESSKNQTCPERLSCQNNCSKPRHFIRENQLSCFCDKECTFFKDCCADFEEYCSSNVNESQMKNQNGLITSENKGLWECFEGDRLSGIIGFWMIGSCPKSWPKDDIFYKCRNLSSANTITKDNYQYLPVYTSDGTVYHNRFCAQCNGVNSQDLGAYKLFFGCSIMPPKSKSRENTIEFLFDYCEAYNIYWTASEGAPRRFCLELVEQSEDYSDCKKDIDGRCTNGSVGIVSIPDKYTNYKNEYCADLCGGFGKYPCGPLSLLNPSGFLSSVQAFSIVLDFRDNTKQSIVKVHCPFKHFYDPYLETCRRGRSPTPQALIQQDHQEYQVILWMTSTVPVNFQIRIKMRNAKVDPKTAGEVLNLKEQQLNNCKMDVLSSSLFTFQFNLNISLGKNNRTRSRRSVETGNDYYVERITNFESLFQLTYLSYNFTVFKVTKRILSCPNLQAYKRNEYKVSSRDDTAVVIIITKEVLRYDEFYTVNDTKPNDSEAIFICRDHRFPNCTGKWILTQEGEFVVLENKSVFVNSSEKMFEFSGYVWENRSIYVCEKFSSSYYKQITTTPQDQHLINLTYVCLLTSIVALFYVLITYSLFSELRTPPGINLVNLSVSILLAQLLWLVGSGQTDKPTACTVIAVLLHYFFLVSIVWTSIIAFDTWRAFTAQGTRRLADSKRSRIIHSLKYMAFGWLSTMLYVIFCFTLDVTKTLNVGYKGDQNVCWMSNLKAKVLVFALPLSFMLTFNTVLYVLTLKAIISSSAQARAATDHKVRKRNFWIYVRIASVMGFTWVFGFVAPFGGQFLQYIFIILNCLQGLYIALAFGLNQRVRALYKTRFPILARFSSSISSESAKSTSKFEKLPEGEANTKL